LTAAQSIAIVRLTNPESRMATQQQKVKEHAKRPSATKSGPGRYHASGTKKASPTPTKGAPFGFVQHHVATAAKKLRRAQVAQMGRRQYLKRQRAERREALPTGLVEA